VLLSIGCSDDVDYDSYANYEQENTVGLSAERNEQIPSRADTLFGELLHYRELVPFGNGFFVFGTTVENPETLQFYFCNIDDESVTLIDQTLTEKFWVQTFYAMPDESLLIAGWPIEGEDEENLRVNDDVLMVYRISDVTYERLLQFPDSIIYSFALNEQDSVIYVLTSNEDAVHTLFAYSFSGEHLYEVILASSMQQIMFSERYRTLYVLEIVGTDKIVHYLNSESGQLNKLSSFAHGAGARFFPSITSGFYVVDGTSFFGFKHETDSFVEITDLSRHGIVGNVLNIFEHFGQYVLHVVDWSTGMDRIIAITPSPEHDGPVQIIRLGRFEARHDFLLEVLVANFNFYNPQYFIEIVNYSVYGNEAPLRLHLDIMTGASPDIFLMSGIVFDGEFAHTHHFLPVQQYIERGLLLDLSPYMERDLDMDTLFESAMQATSINDAHYIVVPSFSLNAFIGRSETVSSINNQSFSGLLNFLSNDFDRDAPSFTTYLSQEEFVIEIVLTSLDYFIDYYNAEAFFDTAYFIELLELAYRLPQSEFGTGVSIARGLADITFEPLRGFFDLEFFSMVLNNKLQTAGFPGSQAGIAMIPSHIFGISSASQNVEGAWAFLRGMYEYENIHNVIGVHFPMNRASFFSAYNLYIENSTSIAANHNRLGQPGMIIEDVDRFGDTVLVEISPVPVENVQIIANEIYSLVQQIDRVYSRNYDIINIILEEISLFFHGGRSAEDTARVVQSRLQRYLSEQFD